MKKTVSLLLSILLIISTFTVLPLSASAETTLDPDKAYILADGVYYEAKKGDVFTYNYYLRVDNKKISSIDVRIDYDADGLTFLPDYDDYGDYDLPTMFPITKDAVCNFEKNSQLKFNYSSATGVRFPKDDSVVFQGKFEVTADSGVFNIDATMITLGDSDLNKIVFKGETYSEYFVSGEVVDLNKVEESTETPTEEPTEAATEESSEVETEAETEDPQPLPLKGKVYLINSAKWESVYAYTWVNSHQNAVWPGVEMTKTDKLWVNGAEIYELEFVLDYDNIIFSNNGANQTQDLVLDDRYITDGYYFDNASNIWNYGYVGPTEEPTEAPTDEPTELPTEESTDAQIPLDPDKVYILADGVYYEAQKGDIFTYKYFLRVDNKKISSIDVRIDYDADGLTFLPDYDEYGDYDLPTMFPITKDAVCNFEKNSQLKFNYSSATGVRFPKDDSVVFQGRFEVTADSGVFNIDATMITLGDSDLNKIVFKGEIYSEYFDASDIADLNKVEEPTVVPTEEATQAPTQVSTDAPTEEPTTAPTETPTDAPIDEPTEVPTEGPNPVPLEGRVYLINSANWNSVYAYTWVDSHQNALWPGVEMTKTDKLWVNGAEIYVLEFVLDYDNIIFSNGGEDQTEDMVLPDEYITDGYYYDNAEKVWKDSYVGPTMAPTEEPTEKPSDLPTEALPFDPTDAPTEEPTEEPTQAPTDAPTEEPTDEPTQAPTDEPTDAPTEEPTEVPTEIPTVEPTEEPTTSPKPVPLSGRVYLINSAKWSGAYAYAWVDEHKNAEWPGVKMTKTDLQWSNGADVFVLEFVLDYDNIIFSDGGDTHTDELELPDKYITDGYFYDNLKGEWVDVYVSPTAPPTDIETQAPSDLPTETPPQKPTDEPTESPTQEVTEGPTQMPTDGPTEGAEPTEKPTTAPGETPTQEPTQEPTETQTDAPTDAPTQAPTQEPTEKPTEAPTDEPTQEPTQEPTVKPDYVVGDIDGNGKVEILDATWLQKHIANIVKLSDDSLIRGDVNFDSKYDILDATLIQKFIANIITEFKPSK